MTFFKKSLFIQPISFSYLPKKIKILCIKYVHKHFWKENYCVLQVFLCALVSQLVAHSLEGTLVTLSITYMAHNLQTSRWNTV